MDRVKTSTSINNNNSGDKSLFLAVILNKENNTNKDTMWIVPNLDKFLEILTHIWPILITTKKYQRV